MNSSSEEEEDGRAGAFTSISVTVSFSSHSRTTQTHTHTHTLRVLRSLLSHVDLVRGGCDERISLLWCNHVILIATSHHWCPAAFGFFSVFFFFFWCGCSSRCCCCCSPTIKGTKDWNLPRECCCVCVCVCFSANPIFVYWFLHVCWFLMRTANAVVYMNPSLCTDVCLKYKCRSWKCAAGARADDCDEVVSACELCFPPQYPVSVSLWEWCSAAVLTLVIS